MDEDDAGQSAAQLLDRAQSGDEAAVSLLVRRYEPELRRFIRVRLTDPRLRRYLDSVDICQAVLGRFFVGFFAGKFVLTNSGQFSTLLLTMAKNEICDQVRRTRALHRGGAAAAPRQPVETLADHHGDHCQQVVNRDLVDTILQQLPERERFLAQRRMDGSEWGEIAADLNIEAETLRKRFSRSVERVLRRLKLQDRPSLVG